LREAKTVEIDRELPLIMEDPDDNKFLNCALFGKADYLVTSDQHLLKLEEYLGIRICKPSQFLRIIKRKKVKRKADLFNRM
jgi:predicted nucleic acid-binding protein